MTAGDRVGCQSGFNGVMDISGITGVVTTISRAWDTIGEWTIYQRRRQAASKWQQPDEFHRVKRDVVFNDFVISLRVGIWILMTRSGKDNKMYYSRQLLEQSRKSSYTGRAEDLQIDFLLILCSRNYGYRENTVVDEVALKLRVADTWCEFKDWVIESVYSAQAGNSNMSARSRERETMYSQSLAEQCFSGANSEDLATQCQE